MEGDGTVWRGASSHYCHGRRSVSISLLHHSLLKYNNIALKTRHQTNTVSTSTTLHYIYNIIKLTFVFHYYVLYE